MRDRRTVVVLVGVVLLGIASLGLPVGPRYLTRSLVFFLAAALALTFGARQRPEPTQSWQVMGVGLVLVAGAWAARAVDPGGVGGFGEWPDRPAGLGLLVIGIGLLLAGRGRRERVELLDGAILAGALLTFIWAAMIDPTVGSGTTENQLAAAGVHTAGATLIVSVAVAIALSDRTTFQSTARLSWVAVAAFLFAGVGWVWQGLSGREQAALGGASWVIAPLLVASIALTKAPRRDSPAVPVGLMTTTRFGLLVLLTLMPALTVLILNAAPRTGGVEAPLTLGLTVTAISVVLLAARIGATAGFAVEDEREATKVRHQRLTEHSADIVALVSSSGVVFYVSPSMSRVLGRDEDHLLGTSFAMLVAAEDRDEFAMTLQRAAAVKGSPVPISPRVLTEDGRMLPAEGTVTDLTDVAGVAGVVVTLRDVSARLVLEDELRRAALEDPLTGLANRTLLTDRAQHALQQRTDGPSRIALLYVDVDDFKTVNDDLGHLAGDHVLKVISDRLRAVVREFDTPGRLGGDEFAILLQSLEADDPVASAMAVAERLLARMEEPIEVAGQSVRIRVSVGLAMGSPGMTVDDLIRNADVAMYSAKQAAGNDLALYDEGMESRARRRLLLTQDLEAALRDGDMALGYQPIVELRSRQVVSVEALLRWDHPRLGSIGAAEVEELAVRGGLSDDLTRWTFARVRKDQTTWVEQFGTPLVVAVNLASPQLSGRMVEIFDEVFGDRLPGAEPHIVVELTESALLRDAQSAASILGQLRARGAHIAIDDFGTGHASLSHLRRLPVDVLKIDREFVAELGTEKAEESFAALIQDLARRLGLITVAEGIENDEQCQAAISLGCQRGQGHLFGRAMPFATLVRDHAMATGGAVQLPDGDLT